MMNIKALTILGFAVVSMGACNMKENEKSDMEKFEKGSFGYDLIFLKDNDRTLVLLKNDAGTAQLIVSPKYQGKVFTSTAQGLKGKSFGWINYDIFDDSLDTHMNGYGGENRLWIGPEGGKYSVFFKPGTEMLFENWHTPAAIDSEPWKLLDADDRSVCMSKNMVLQNYVGTQLHININREVSLLGDQAIEAQFGIALGQGVKVVGYSTSNSITNTGDSAWTTKTGAPCLWMLDMFAPSPETVVIIPYIDSAKGPVATTDYFGEIPKERIHYDNGILLFKADGKSRGKLGVPPQRAKSFAGSYDALNKVLTVTVFDIVNKGTYLNQEWNTDNAPLVGDAVNAYNDGPLEDGTQMGPFYEIESVSPAAFLQSGEKLDHQHSVFHFTGEEADLDNIAQKIFGISLQEVKSAFN